MKLIMISLLFGSLFLHAQTNAEAIQIPPAIQIQLQSYQDRFNQNLQEECSNSFCTPVGCEVMHFLTLDEQQDASLPGLESAKEASGSPQYKLAAVKCEFTYESALSDEDLNSLKQRLMAKSKLTGTSLSLKPVKLTPKALILKPQTEDAATKGLNKTGAPIAEINPWLKLSPWMAFVTLFALLILLLIWGFRRIGKTPLIIPESALPEGDLALANSEKDKPLALPEPSTQAIVMRIQQLKEKIKSPDAMTIALKPLVQKNELRTLCQVLRHFGSESLAGFGEQLEHRETLQLLKEAYQNFTEIDNNTEIWQFLDKIERYLVASEIGGTEATIKEEFSFLDTLESGEFFHLLQTLTETDKALVLSFAPSHLQNAFFKRIDSNLLSPLIEEISRSKELSDKVVREKVSSIREVYFTKRTELKTVSLDRLNMLEQLINQMDTASRKIMMQKMKSQQTDLFQSLLPQIFVDESLLVLPPVLLNEIFVSISPEKIAPYLDSLPYREQILNRLNPSLAQSIRKWSHLYNSDSLSYNDVGRMAIASDIKERAQKGQLNLKSINESLMQGPGL